MNSPCIFLPTNTANPTDIKHLAINSRSRSRRLNIHAALQQGPQGLIDALYMANLADILGVHIGDPEAVIRCSFENRVAHAKASCWRFDSPGEREVVAGIIAIYVATCDILLDEVKLAAYISASAREGGLLSFQNQLLLNNAPARARAAQKGHTHIRPLRQRAGRRPARAKAPRRLDKAS